MSTNTYYVEGLYYSTLTDLLSDGWAEDKQVDVIAPDGGTVGRPTIAALRAEYQTDSPASFAKPRRVCAKANEGFVERTPSGGVRYAVALITEGKPGWVASHWYSTLEEAQRSAGIYNQSAKLSAEDISDISISSIRASRTR